MGGEKGGLKWVAGDGQGKGGKNITLPVCGDPKTEGKRGEKATDRRGGPRFVFGINDFICKKNMIQGPAKKGWAPGQGGGQGVKLILKKFGSGLLGQQVYKWEGRGGVKVQKAGSETQHPKTYNTENLVQKRGGGGEKNTESSLTRQHKAGSGVAAKVSQN